MNTLADCRIDDERLNEVNGGTFGENRYAREVYEHAGFKCNYHFFARDEFIMNGKVYHEEEANAIVERMGYKIYKVYKRDQIICIVEVNGQQVMKYYESYDDPEE